MINQNKKYLSVLVHAIKYYGLQGITLTKLRDNGLLLNGQESNVNCGNFEELIKLVSEFHSELKVNMLSYKTNVTYQTKATQSYLFIFILFCLPVDEITYASN